MSIFVFRKNNKRIITVNRKIKLIWDFRGEDALEMAKHHCLHLKEFALADSLSFHEIDFKELDNFYALAFIIVDEKDMKIYRDSLKPHRGEIA
ncbi:hypothetical protein OD91_1092 [Lutibacter sp. Hel_I_33_5]|uniref:hypothetical protein n=1 Tax=Lutibacter sp. Hel_I_33_5 TaxID=1566289 RepID=UPI0011ADB333|nr:hypothetical protein [Lutibacter sp. Hel_I_33_5]TVZ55824.1 hypothetical protein OD91_1092 [Lutibacter sp. Hel_I_33_5]